MARDSNPTLLLSVFFYCLTFNGLQYQNYRLMVSVFVVIVYRLTALISTHSEALYMTLIHSVYRLSFIVSALQVDRLTSMWLMFIV